MRSEYSVSPSPYCCCSWWESWNGIFPVRSLTILSLEPNRNPIPRPVGEDRWPHAYGEGFDADARPPRSDEMAEFMHRDEKAEADHDEEDVGAC